MGLLKSLFGPSKAEVWSELARQVGGDFTPDQFLQQGGVTVKVGDWQVQFDTYTTNSGNHSQTYTRVRAPFVNPERFRFKVYRAGFFSPLGKLFGVQDIVVGHEFFDRAFVIQGNDASRVRDFFQDDHLRALVASQPNISLEIVDDEGMFGPTYGNDVDLLKFSCTGVIKHLDVLRGLYDIFAHSLTLLARRSAGYDDENAPADTPAVVELRSTVERQTEWLAANVAHHGDAIEAMVTLTEAGDDLAGRLTVNLPVLPADVVGVHLAARVPDDGVPFALKPAQGFVASLENFRDLDIGRADVDPAYVIEAEEKAAATLRAAGDPLAALARMSAGGKCNTTVRCEGTELYVSAYAVPRATAGAAIDAVTKAWRALARARAGLRE
jgi:hypothetical protein